eukprot:TRINITY_DN19581_c0_g1_i1.p1 TRINITY_DN19581_c0_g1~~TRINITY_DN19581_c0_g1_i1.p1  ORF type:complete len:175 (-),score=16.79 TRINITY_DN19581_c0_g1_i1:130-588(-)
MERYHRPVEAKGEGLPFPDLAVDEREPSIGDLEGLLKDMRRSFLEDLRKVSLQKNRTFDQILGILTDLQSRQSKLEAEVKGMQGAGRTTLHVAPVASPRVSVVPAPAVTAAVSPPAGMTVGVVGPVEHQPAAAPLQTKTADAMPSPLSEDAA